MACQDASLNQHHLILLGAEPDSPDPDYGWIVPGGPARYPFTDNRLFAVSKFYEKPTPRMAEHLLSIGGMWSTFVVVGTLQAFDQALFRYALGWHAFAEAVTNAADNDGERLLAERTYQNRGGGCFSADVLSPSPDRCLVVRMRNAGWTDVGTPTRLANVRSRVSA
jgi:mannose-1-phosphate guanylyltransferase